VPQIQKVVKILSKGEAMPASSIYEAGDGRVFCHRKLVPGFGFLGRSGTPQGSIEVS
jgi:hypothetical protein